MAEYKIFVSAVTIFENEGISDNICLFSASGELLLYNVTKNRKSWPTGLHEN